MEKEDDRHMSIAMWLLEPRTLIIIGIATLSIVLLIVLLYIYVNIHRLRHRRRWNAAIVEKRLAYAPATSPWDTNSGKTPARFVSPLVKLTNSAGPDMKNELSTRSVYETNSKFSLSPAPSNYKTFDLAKRYQRHFSSDSSYTSSNARRTPAATFSFDNVKSKFQQAHRCSPTAQRPLESIQSDRRFTAVSSDSDEGDRESVATSVTPSLEYSLAQVFRVEIIYRLFYSIDDRQLHFQLQELMPTQVLIERCFPSLICKIRLYTDNGKRKGKKYFTKKGATNEIFKFDIAENALEQSYLKIHLVGQQHNDKRLELGHLIVILNQCENLIQRTHRHYRTEPPTSETHRNFIVIDADRIELINEQQVGVLHTGFLVASSSSLQRHRQATKHVLSSV
jgi:hypothetical protein